MASLAGSIDAGDGIDEDTLLDGLVKFVKKCITVDGFGWLHPDCLTHICTAACPGASHSGQALLEVLKKQKPAGILYIKKDKTVKHKGVTLKISWERQGAEYILKDGEPRRLNIYYFSLVVDPGVDKTSWQKFRKKCLAQMTKSPRPLDDYKTVVKALGQIDDVINECPLPLPPVADEKRERLKLAMFLAGVAPPPASLGLNHRWQPAAVAVRQAWQLTTSQAGGDPPPPHPVTDVMPSEATSTNGPSIAASPAGGPAATATVLDIDPAAAAQQLRKVLDLVVSMYNSAMHDPPSDEETSRRRLHRKGRNTILNNIRTELRSLDYCACDIEQSDCTKCQAAAKSADDIFKPLDNLRGHNTAHSLQARLTLQRNLKNRTQTRKGRLALHEANLQGLSARICRPDGMLYPHWVMMAACAHKEKVRLVVGSHVL